MLHVSGSPRALPLCVISHSCSCSDFLTLCPCFSDPVLHHLAPVSSSPTSNGKNKKVERRCLLTLHLYTSLSLFVSFICSVSWTKRKWPGQDRGSVRRSLRLSGRQPLGSGCRPGIDSGHGSACLIEVPGGEKRGHLPTRWSQKQKVLFTRLILRRLSGIWMTFVNEEKQKEKENKQVEKKKSKNSYLWICCLFSVLLGRTVMQHLAWKRSVVWKEWSLMSGNAIQKPGGPKLIMLKTHTLLAGREREWTT